MRAGRRNLTRRLRHFLVLSCFAIRWGSAATGPLAPVDAFKSFELEPGLRVQLAAAEPLTASPCAIAWDEHGRMYVAENRGYPSGGPAGQSVGVVALLEDTDGDGIVDKRTEFATGLSFPNGVMPWRGGLIVTCSPDVYFLKDTNGDGIANVKEVLLTGFATNQSTQLRVNKPMLAQDGWVYVASGLSSGKITSPKRPQDKPLELKGDLRFNPDTGEYQQIDGKSQFGQSFDDFGERFGLFNRVQVQHFALPSHYIERNPHLASPGVLQNCPDLIDNPFLPGHNGAARVYPISANITTADSHVGTFTAACALHIYRGGALPAHYYGHAFSCEPTGNLVHQDRLEPLGATFAARREGENIEFLRSRDDWFRPVFLAVGPDGALYICDMYRKVIEHPDYLPNEIRKHSDFESGKKLGRIWRVTADKSPPRPPKFAPFPSSTKSLVSELAASNEWRRDTAFRLLCERNDPATGQLLKKGWAKSKTPAEAAAKLQMLARFHALDETTISAAVASTNDGLRQVAIRLSEPQLRDSLALQKLVLQGALDPSPRVRFATALALGEMNNSLEALAKISIRDASDKWTRAAILSSIAGRERRFLALLLQSPPTANESLPILLEDLGHTLGAALPRAEQLAVLRENLVAASASFDRIAAIISGIGESSSEAIRDLAQGHDSSATLLAALAANAQTEVGNHSASVPKRACAAGLLAFAAPAGANPVLLNALRPGEPQEVQAAAIRALTERQNTNGVRELLQRSRWPGYTPAQRAMILGAVLNRSEHQTALFDAIENGAVPASAIDSNRRAQLKKSKNETIRQKAETLFPSSGSGDRQLAYDQAKACLTLHPVPANGKEVFKRACASCHRLDQEGVAVGPDLLDIRNQPKETILLHIVIPELEIAPNFANYTCETKDGRSLSGIIVGETTSSVTIRQAQGLEATIQRADIANLVSSALSLMPQDLEKAMTQQEMADLLSYLRGEQ